MKLIQKYKHFVLENFDIIERIEKTVKSLSYVVLGRFDDSIVISELCTHINIHTCSTRLVSKLLLAARFDIP